MQSSKHGRNGVAQILDTLYTSFRSTDGMRSPRTPTYIPESPSTGSLAPFDHAEFLDKSERKAARDFGIPPPPENPGTWVWTCHLCHSRYPLGVTRRCLVDGHYYCSGETDRPSLRKRKKPKSCTSEFDYHAWKVYGEWRRRALQAMQNPNQRVLKGCDYCDFPSQCRSVETQPFPGLGTLQEFEAEAASTAQRDRDIEATNTTSKDTSKETIDLEQILNDVFTGNKQGKESSKKSSKGRSRRAEKDKTISSKHRKESQTVLIPTLQEEMAKEASRVQALVEMDVWSGLEEVHLEKDKVE